MKCVLVLIAALVCVAIAEVPFPDLVTSESNSALRWSDVHGIIIRTPPYPLSPPLSARALAVLDTVIYDAWTFFDSVARPSISYEGLSKRKGSASDIDVAISVAAWKTLRHIYFGLPNSAFVNTTADQLLSDITGLTAPTSSDKSTPIGLGNRVADILNAYRDADGSNCLGTHPFTIVTPTGVKCYQDYTNYSPVNRPYNISQPRLPNQCDPKQGGPVNINKWEPLTTVQFANGSGTLTRAYLSPFMAQVKPFALEYNSQYRPQGPPVQGLAGPGRMSFEEQHGQVLHNSSVLDDREKIIAEFWAPSATVFGNPPNMFHAFALNALVTSDASVKSSAQLMFAVSNAVLDAGISCWDTKRFFDSSRPITAIRCLYAGQQVQAWGGFYRGVTSIDGGTWLPYQELMLVTPPFSEYASGHSTFSSAAAHVLTQFFGAKWIGPNSYTVPEGASALEPKIVAGQPGFVAGLTDVANEGYNTAGYTPRASVTLEWDTWEDAAREAAISRVYGGIHIHDAVVDAADVGRKIGVLVWDRASALFAGRDPDAPVCSAGSRSSSEVSSEVSSGFSESVSSEESSSSSSVLALSFGLLFCVMLSCIGF